MTRSHDRNQAGYDGAIALLRDLQAIADGQKTSGAFARRIDQLRGEHAKKLRFIERLASLDIAR